ncbi:MAG: 5'/3'-nucleotidase SurE [Nitrospira bacterium HGW-Nitrospira-1]|nr:MAG: 5'/3'-nucleotidase SurE [Nitrospira bacterium HGW-Nitrospira-1]
MAVILVTNDDGVYSPGIIALYKTMQNLGDVYMVAPDRERSAAGHSLTMHRPLKAEEISEHVFSVNGTPTDCVTLGINKLLPQRPDLIVSGINKGANLGDDITYSGTVAAAIEGTIFSIPSIAFSLISARRYHFDTGSFFALKIAEHVLSRSLPYDTLLNVNIPNIRREDIKGIKLTRQGKRIYENSIQEVLNPQGEKHFWIGGGKIYREHGEDTDMEAVEQNFVSISPIHLDLTNFSALKFMMETWKISEMLEE